MNGIRLTPALVRALFPEAPSSIVNAFVEKQHLLSAVGVNQTRRRLAYFFANIHHETGGFTIRDLTENINYSADRMAAVWPNRFTSAASVRDRYGTGPGWQRRAFDDIYGNRMGNRRGTNDGSTFIGRGGPQVTGRNGYEEVGKRIGVDLASKPTLACDPGLQPDICTAFWDWKGLNKYADDGNFLGCVKLWNGGTNGLKDRQVQLARISAHLQGAEWGQVPSGTLAEAPVVKPKPAPVPTKVPSPKTEQGGMGFFTSFINALSSLFRKKT